MARITAPSTEGDQATTVLDLDEDVVGCIAAYLDHKDIEQLRLTCKLFCLNLQRVFGSRFRHRHFIFTPYSMEAFVSMSAHPILGPWIESVAFGTYRIAGDPDIVVPGVTDHSPRQLSFTKQWEMLDLQKLRFNEQTQFIASRRHRELLTQALKNLMKHRRTIKLGTFDDIVSCTGDRLSFQAFSGLGSKRFYENTFLACRSRDSYETLGILIKASRQASYPMEHLNVALHCGCRTQQYGCKHDWGKVSAWLNDFLTQSIADGTSLVMTVANRNFKELYINRDQRLIAFRGECLQPRSIRHCTDGSTNASFGRLGIAMYADEYQNIEISDCGVQWSPFIRFLTQHASTILTLRLQRMLFWNRTWSIPFLETALELPHLENLIMEEVFYYNNIDKELKFIVAGKKEWRGSKDIRSGLHDLIEQQTPSIPLDRNGGWIDEKVFRGASSLHSCR